MIDIEQRVDRGARRLDEHMPGWYELVEPEALQMAHSTKCLLWQLYGDYNRGKKELGVGLGQSCEYGFNCDYLSYGRLKELWTREVALRKLAASSPVSTEHRELIGV